MYEFLDIKGIKKGMTLKEMQSIFDFETLFKNEFLNQKILTINNKTVNFELDDWKHLLFGGDWKKIKNPDLKNLNRAKCFLWAKKIIPELPISQWRLDIRKKNTCLLYFNGEAFPHYLVILKANKKGNFHFITGYPTDQTSALRIFNAEYRYKKYLS